jgi:hypothetical protein
MIFSGDNQVMTQQSVTDGEKIVTEKENMEMESLQGGNSDVLNIDSTGKDPDIEQNFTQTNTLVQGVNQTIRSEEMDEELVDYDGDYELTEQEKADMEQYEKELADQEENEQRAQMPLLKKKIKERTQQLGPVMNFIKGATSNMNEDVFNEESEEEITKKPKEKQASGKIKEGGDKTGPMARGVNVQPAIAQRRSLRTTNQGNILEQATKLKAQKNGLTGKSQFTAFTSQPSDKLSKVAKIYKINLSNETEAHLAIDRLKAHEAAKAAILEAKQKKSSNHNNRIYLLTILQY